MEDTVGLIYMDSRLTPADLSSGNRELLQTLAIEASTILENARLIEEERGKLRMEDELRLAREIQQGLQPTSMPQDWMVPRRRLQFAFDPGGRRLFRCAPKFAASWTAVVADVSGKGVGSALLASLLQGTFLMASGDPRICAPHGSASTNSCCSARAAKNMLRCSIAFSSVGPFELQQRRPLRAVPGSPDGRLHTLNTTSMPVGMLEEAPFEMLQRNWLLATN